MAGATVGAGAGDDALDDGELVGVPVGPNREPPGPPMAGATVVVGAGATVGAGAGAGTVVAGAAVVDEPAAFVTGRTAVVGAETRGLRAGTERPPVRAATVPPTPASTT